MGGYRVSMDIGGTFTDVVAYQEDAGTYAAGKTSTTPNDLTEGVFAALSQVVEDVPEIGFFVHGTTVGLNAFLRRRGERVLLLATEGVGDTYQLRRRSGVKNVQATEHVEAWTAYFHQFGRETLAQFEPEVVPESEKTGRRFEPGVVD
jgi:N-methylhydantoinase A/oxoprolinase/acetone carboxylase beta subunit